MYSCLISAYESVATKAEPVQIYYPQEHNGAIAKPVQRIPGSQQQILPAGQRQGRPQPAVPPFQQQVSRPQGFKMQASQTKDTPANRSEFNAWLDYFGTMGEKPPDRTREPPDIITAAQEYLASRIELSIT